MKPVKNWAVIWIGGALLVLTAFMVSCQTTLSNAWQGAVAEPESRIVLLEGGPHPGSLMTRHLSLRYEYVRAPENLQISGAIELTGPWKHLYDHVDYFFLTVNFLDMDGSLLERTTVMTYMIADRIDDPWPFKRELAIPPGVTAMAFGYKGRVIENETDGFSGFDNFYLNPLR